MVCDIVDQEQRFAQLDPEDMRDLVTAFHRLAGDTVARLGGYVAQCLSNGAIAYFGYPAADEHEAERAVRAGLAILDATPAPATALDMPFRTRVGIATGVVVIGQQSGTGDMQTLIAIGETPNLAARLVERAKPGEVVIEKTTHRLVERLFDCHVVDAVGGTQQAVAAWRVSGERRGVSRLQPRAAASYPLVGRREEMELLLRRWDRVRTGEGQVVLIAGEPGIGKSRIAKSLLDGLEAEPNAHVNYSCSPLHINSTLYPFISELERAAGFELGSSTRAKLDRLEELLTPPAKDPLRDLSLMAELLGLPMEGRYPVLAASPQQKREMTLAALLNRLEDLAVRNPVLIVF
jgi:class 3 adenylate cyclase